MHEASIAASIIEIAEEHCRKAGYGRIDSVEVDIGHASGVLADALLMAFDIVKLETLANEASLIINNIPIGGDCHGCGEPFTTEEMFLLACPGCGGGDFSIKTGREMNIKEIEVN